MSTGARRALLMGGGSKKFREQATDLSVDGGNEAFVSHTKIQLKYIRNYDPLLISVRCG